MVAAHTLLVQNRNYRYYWLSRTISSFGDSIASVALVLYVFHQYKSASAVGILLFAQVLPRMLGPFTGTLADCVDQKKLLIVCELAQAVVFTVLAFWHPAFAVLVGFIVTSTIFSTLFMPAGKSALTTFVPQHDLMNANGLLRTSFQVSRVLGPLISGFLVSWFTASMALEVDAITFLCSAIMILRLPKLPRGIENKEARFISDVCEGLRYISRHTVVRTLTIVMSVYVGFAAADNVALVLFTHTALHAGDAGYSWLTSAYGIGMVLGALCVMWMQRKLSAATMLFVGIGMFGTGTLLTGLTSSLWAAILFQVIAAVGNSFESIATDTVVQQVVPHHMLGRVFGTLYSSLEGSSSVAFAIGGVFLNLMSARMVFLFSGVGVLVAALCSYKSVGRTQQRRYLPDASQPVGE